MQVALPASKYPILQLHIGGTVLLFKDAGVELQVTQFVAELIHVKHL